MLVLFLNMYKQTQGGLFLLICENLIHQNQYTLNYGLVSRILYLPHKQPKKKNLSGKFK